MRKRNLPGCAGRRVDGFLDKHEGLVAPGGMGLGEGSVIWPQGQEAAKDVQSRGNETVIVYQRKLFHILGELASEPDSACRS